MDANRELSGGEEADQREEVLRRLEEEFVPLLREQPGYRGYLSLVDERDEHGRVVTLWESSEAADRGLFLAGPAGGWVQDRLTPLLAEAPRIDRAAAFSSDLGGVTEGATVASITFVLPLSPDGRAGGD